MRRRLLLLTFLLTLSLGAAPKHYWQLGYGAYAPYLTNSLQVVPELDLARWDWLVVEIDSDATIQAMNRLLEINPKLKYLARLWPINGMGDPEYRVAQGTCLDYMLYPEKRAEIDTRARASIRQLRAGIRNWDSIVCFTFLEELPMAWGCGELLPYNGQGPLPRTLEFHRAAIEKARGKALVWDTETKRWLGQQFSASLEAIHRLIKEESGGKLVFYWHHTNYATLDDLPDPLPAGFDLVGWGGYPVRFDELVKPGVCDGLMAYPNSPSIWEEKYMRHIRAHHWLFYSQLSHPSFMRLSAWPETVQMVTAKMPENLGTFLYCEGSCAAKGSWNDDGSMPADPRWQRGSASQALHLRHLARQFGVGLDVVQRYQHLRVTLDAQLGQPKAGDVFHLVALIENPKDETYYGDAAAANANEVRVKLSLPRGLVNDPKISAAPELSVGAIAGRARRLADWWVTVNDPSALQAGQPIVVAASSANAAPGRAETTRDTAFPSLQAHAIAASGTTWAENGFRYAGLRPLIELVASGEPVRNPSVSDGENTLGYSGEIWSGMRLVIRPELRARLYPDNPLAAAAEQLKDAADPSGYRCFSDGYGVYSFNVGSYLRPGAKYRLTIAGKASDGAQSLVVLRAPKADGSIWQESFLANRFGESWAEASQDIDIPADVSSLERLYLYRFNTKGRVWYGPLSLVPADLPAEGLDVSARLSGRPVRIGEGMLTDFTYRDESPDTATPKLSLTLRNPADTASRGVQRGF